MRQVHSTSSFVIALVITMVVGEAAINPILAQSVGDYRSASSGIWSAIGSWQYYDGNGWTTPPDTVGYPGQKPGTANVTIQNGNSITLDVSPVNPVASINISGTSTNTTLTFNSGTALTVSGPTTIDAPTSNYRTNTMAVGAGSLNAGSITMANTGNNRRDCIVSLTTGGITIRGDLTMQGSFAENHIDITGAGTINIGGNVDNGAGAVGGGFTTPPAASVINLNGATLQNVFLYGGGRSLGILKINNAMGVTSGSAFTTVTLSIGDVAPGSSLDVGTYSETVSGNLLVNGSLNGTGGITLSGSGATIDGTGTIAAPMTASTSHTINSTADLTITGTMTINRRHTVTNNGVVSVGDLGTATGTWAQGNNSTLNYSGTAITPTLNASASDNTVNYTGDAQTVKVTTYHNLILSGNGDKTFAVTTVNGDLSLTGAAKVTTGANLTVGGNLNIGDNTSFTVPAHSLSVSGTTTVGGGTSGTLAITSVTEAKTFAGAVTINGGADFTEIAAASLVFGSNVTVSGTLTEFGAATVSVAGSFTNNGTYTASTGTHTFSGSSKTIGGSAAISIPNLAVTGTYSNSCGLTVGTSLSGAGALANEAGYTLNIGGTSTISTLAAIASGNTVNYAGANQAVHLNDYCNLTFSGSGTVTLPNGAMSISGNWTNNGVTITPGSSTVTFNGISPQTIGGTTPTAFNDLTINNSAGVQFGDPVSVSGTLTLVSGIVTTSSTNLLTTESTSTSSIIGASASSYINGPLALTLAAGVAADGTSYTFPVGDPGNFRPLALVNVRTAAGSSPVVKVTEIPTGALTGDSTITSVAPRNWHVETSGGTLASATIQLAENGLIPTNAIAQSTMQSGNYASIGGTNIGATITSVQAASSFPVYFAIGISSVMGLYSYQSGNWDDPNTWTTDPSGRTWTNARVPSMSGADRVTILNGRTISISANAKKTSSLTLNAGGVLNLHTTTGHDFGTVSGQGKLILSSNSFPGGTFTGFVAVGCCG